MFERGRSKWARERLRLRRDAPPPSDEGDDFESGFLQDSLPGLTERESRPRWRAALAGAASDAAAAVSVVVETVGHLGGWIFAGIRDSLASVGHYLGDGWFALSLEVRQRLAAFVLALSLAAVVWFLVLPVAPCWAPAGDRCPPGNDSLALIPEDAAAYLHINLDPDTEQADAAGDLVRRLPALTRVVIGGRDQTGQTAPGIVDRLVGRQLDFAGQVLAWSGRELAVALLNRGAAIEPVLIIEIEDRAGAEEFVAELGRDGEEIDYEGTTIVEGAGAATALTDEFALVGDPGSIRDVIDVLGGESRSLEDNAAAEQLFDRLPDRRLIEAWLSPDAAAALLQGGSAGPFDTFVHSESTSGVAASLSVDAGVVDLAVRSGLDAEKAKTTPSVFAALPGFEPSLPETVGEDVVAYLGLGEPGRSLVTLIDRAEADAPGLAAGFDVLAKRLEREGVDLAADVLPLLGGEVALTVEPRSDPAEAESQTPGVAAPAPVPYAALLAEGVDMKQAEGVLARLQRPLSSGVDAGESGRAALPSSSEIGGVDVQVLRLSSLVELTYGFVDDRLAVATDPDGIRRLVSDLPALSELDAFEKATDELPETPALLLYLDLAGVVAQLEAGGLGSDTAYGPYAQDLRALDVAALAVSGGVTRIDTDLRLIVGEPQPAESPLPPIQPTPESG